ncbi:hypothetical protein ACI3K4_09420 [Streptomyces sp. CSMPJR101]|uniref:hypothetical protein n=1 Tax=Streptomyces sp. CSMPJR101 TaxID=1279378 RepID=UPI003854A259
MDDDVVAPQMRQYGDIRNLFDEVEASRGEERRDAFRRLMRQLATMALMDRTRDTVRKAMGEGG